ncbi:hypothetical protein TM102_24220 [Bradyrhizobium sp. TM102]|nr:hypothetical protein TM102_24220 [Bradyrhizobium sp. TM102]
MLVENCCRALRRRPESPPTAGVSKDGHGETLPNAIALPSGGAKVLAEKGYHYQYLFVRNAKHVDRSTIAQTLPSALEWIWKGYPSPERGAAQSAMRLGLWFIV